MGNGVGKKICSLFRSLYSRRSSLARFYGWLWRRACGIFFETRNFSGLPPPCLRPLSRPGLNFFSGLPSSFFLLSFVQSSFPVRFRHFPASQRLYCYCHYIPKWAERGSLSRSLFHPSFFPFSYARRTPLNLSSPARQLRYLFLSFSSVLFTWHMLNFPPAAKKEKEEQNNQVFFSFRRRNEKTDGSGQNFSFFFSHKKRKRERRMTKLDLVASEMELGTNQRSADGWMGEKGEGGPLLALFLPFFFFSQEWIHFVSSYFL